MSAADNPIEARSGGAAVQVQVGTAPQASSEGAPDASSSSGEPTFLRWWPVIIGVLGIAFVSGGTYWQTNRNAADLVELRGEVKAVGIGVNALLQAKGIAPTTISRGK